MLTHLVYRFELIIVKSHSTQGKIYYKHWKRKDCLDTLYIIIKEAFMQDILYVMHIFFD